MKLRPIQKSFQAGEITPKLHSRPDLEVYRQGAKFMENFMTTPYGSAKRRSGFKLNSEVSDSDVDGRIFDFRVEGSNSFIVAITETDITLYNSAGPVPTENIMTNPSFEEGSTGWNVNATKTNSDPLSEEPRVLFSSGSARVISGNAAYVTSSGFPEPTLFVNLRPCDVELTQQVTVSNGGNIHNLKINIVDGSFDAQGALLDYLSIGTTEGANDIGFTVDPMDSSIAVFTPGGPTFWISYKMAWDDSNDLSVGGTVPSPGNIGKSAEVNIDSFVLTDTQGSGSDIVSFTCPYTLDEIKELQVEKAPGQNIMYFAVRSSTATHKLTYDVPTDSWTFVAVVFSNPPATWASDGYPGAITFYQGRMWLAGNITNPATVWGSKSGESNYEDFDVGSAQDDEGLELPLARDGVIQWIQGGKALHVGTDTAEHSITGQSNLEILTPTNARAFQQSSYGSFRVHAKWLSEKISFISQDQRRIYLGDYNRETLGFISDEISYFAEHITEPGVLEAAWGQAPRARVWCSKEDGTIVGCAYQRETSSIGWFRINTPQGIVKSIATTEEFGRSVLWILVERFNKLYLERLNTSVFLDSFVTRQYASPQTTVDGLDHLNGQVVDLIGDDAYQGRFVVSGGEVTSPNEASTFHAGIPCPCKLVTLPVEELSSNDNLTAKFVRWNRIYARILASINPLINGIRPPERTAPTPMNTREPDKSVDVSVATVGRDRFGEITIEQDLPFNCEVAGVFGELYEEGL